MTETTDNKRPVLLKIISALLILAGISGMLTNFLDLDNNIDNKLFQEYLNSRTLIDKIGPYVLNPLLILSAIYMFKGKLLGIKLYLGYLVLSALATVILIVSTTWFAYFGMKGIAATTASMSISVTIYFYLKNLEKKGILIE